MSEKRYRIQGRAPNGNEWYGTKAFPRAEAQNIANGLNGESGNIKLGLKYWIEPVPEEEEMTVLPQPPRPHRRGQSQRMENAMNYHKTLFNQILEEEKQGSAPVTVACACHAMEVFARHFETMRPGDVIAIVHPDKCMEHDSGNPDCSCNDDDHQDIARIE